MLASQILHALQNCPFKKFFRGIFASDTVPSNLKDGYFIIVNTDKSSGGGKHWFTIVRRQNVIECFDSLGVNDAKKSYLLTNLKFKNVQYLKFNSTPIQPLMSVLCGQYVLYFLYERYVNFDIDFDALINEVFFYDVNKNDRKVIEFFEEFYV